MSSLQSQYAASQARLLKQADSAADAARLDTAHEAGVLADRFKVSRKKRVASEYAELAAYLSAHYPPEVAYYIAVDLNERFEPRLGYPPIGQVMVAMEQQESKFAARWIACALRNFPRVETARLAFGVIKSPVMRSLVRAELAAEGAPLAEYISSGEPAAGTPKPASPTNEGASRTREASQSSLSDGIERMPRHLTEAERSGDRLFLHFQVLSNLSLLLCPAIGGVVSGLVGAGLGLAAGWMIRAWMRRSMGLRGSNPTDGFFVRMRERANGSRRGILEALIERRRRRPFTREQCAAITQAWDEARRRLAATTSQEEKRALLDALDIKVKRISYGQHG